MRYVSTRNRAESVSPSQAVLRGLAPDGGLYVPEEIPSADLGEAELRSFSYDMIAARVIGRLLPDFGEDVIARCVSGGYEGKFDVPQRVALKEAGGRRLLELWHGPTSAFKDMALCVLPRLLTAAQRMNGESREAVILTATSGDTGKAALAGFADVPGTRIMVFYPVDGVSAVQKAQMQTQKGSNVCVCAIEGNFDDAQRGVKQAFEEIRTDRAVLSSANSINIGRLAPQVAYYFYAYGRLLEEGSVSWGDPVSFTVPTGNFGDILAGWLAKRMGLPVGKLRCASNANRVLTDFLSTGVYDRRRELALTQSPSMDILVSSNLERLLFFASGMDDRLTAELMERLARDGVYEAPAGVMESIRADFGCGCADDARAAEEIKKLWEKDGYLMDTHTAVAFACSEPGDVVLSTASPFKFAPAILAALGRPVPESGFEAMDALSAFTGIPVPPGLAELRSLPLLHRDVIERGGITAYIKGRI
jgi:threonine synthase